MVSSHITVDYTKEIGRGSDAYKGHLQSPVAVKVLHAAFLDRRSAGRQDQVPRALFSRVRPPPQPNPPLCRSFHGRVQVGEERPSVRDVAHGDDFEEAVPRIPADSGRRSGHFLRHCVWPGLHPLARNGA